MNQGQRDNAYKIQISWEYQNSLEIDKLKEAWIYAQRRFGSLRLRIAWLEELVQIIEKESHLNWRYVDLSKEQNDEDKENKVSQILKSDQAITYDLEHGNLFSLSLIKRKENLYTCIFNHHHIISDGWSNRILLQYVHSTYLRLIRGEKIEESIDHSYMDTQKYLQENQNNNIDYWNQYLSSMEEQSHLAGFCSDYVQKLSLYKLNPIKQVNEQQLIINNGLYLSLKNFSKDYHVTLNSILQYTWHKVLNIYSSSLYTIVGTTVSGRNLSIDNIENSVGLYINTLPLIVKHDKVTTG